MRSFDYGKLADKAWDNDILNLVAKIHEYKGRQDLFVRRKPKPAELDRLVEIAKIQSTESSNKIEGIITTSTRMKQLFEEKTVPRIVMKMRLWGIEMYCIQFMRVMNIFPLDLPISCSFIGIF